MSDSLRDQLLKSGLVQKLRAEARPEPRRRADSGRKPAKPAAQSGNAASAGQSQPHERDLARAYALRARQERQEREHAQRESARAARERKERKQKLAALLAGKSQNSGDADVARHFPHGNKIRRIYCTAGQLKRLNGGELAVVQLAGRYLLVERDIALQAQAIQPEALVLLCDPDAAADDDVPADIVW